MATAGDARGAGPERAYCPHLPASGLVTLDRDEGHHLVRARRARVGDPVVLFDGRGGSVLARLVEARGEAPVLDVLGPAPDREPRRRVVLVVSLPAAGKADDLVASLAELGVSLLIPLRTRRTAVEPLELVARRTERWTRLVREAAKVNGRSRLLEVGAPLAPAEVPGAARAAGGTPILLDTAPGLPPLGERIAPGDSPWILVGPEGGFDEAEMAALAAVAVPAASLGRCALRTELAAVVAAGIALA